VCERETVLEDRATMLILHEEEAAGVEGLKG
jgi:hypothetical protein